MSIQPRQPAGRPTGGRYAATTHADNPQVVLARQQVERQIETETEKYGPDIASRRTKDWLYFPKATARNVLSKYPEFATTSYNVGFAHDEDEAATFIGDHVEREGLDEITDPDERAFIAGFIRTWAGRDERDRKAAATGH